MRIKIHQRLFVLVFSLIILDIINIYVTLADKITTTYDLSLTLSSCMAQNPIFSITFSADDKSVLATWDLGEVKLWDTETSKLIQIFDHNDAKDIEISPNNKYVATSNGTETIIWNANTGKKLHTLVRTHKDIYGRTDIVFTKDSQYVLTSGFDGANLWKTDSGEKVSDLPADDSRWAAQLSPDGKRVITSGSEGIILWNALTGQKIQSIINAGSDLFSPDGKWIVTNGRDGLVIWNSDKLEEKSLLDPKVDDRYLYYFSPDSKYLLIGESISKAIVIWNIQTGNVVAHFEKKDVQSITFMPIENRVLIIENANHTTSLNRLYTFDLLTNKTMSDTDVPIHSLSVYAISHDGNYLLSGSVDGKIDIWEIKTGKKIREFC